MQRRRFLQVLGLGLTAAVVAPAALLSGKPSGPSVVDVSADGKIVRTTGWTEGGDSLRIGDTFTIEGVNSKNRHTYLSTGQPQWFVVTDEVRSTGESRDYAVMPNMWDASNGGVWQNIDRRPTRGARVQW